MTFARLACKKAERAKGNSMANAFKTVAIVGKSDDDFRTTLQVFGFFGIVVTAVIQMRVVAQILRRDDGGTNRRV